MADETLALHPVIDGIARVPVDSSNLASIGYDETRHVLAVGFKSGAIFHYRGVESGLWERFHMAPSKGSFFAHHVKGRYQGEKMTGPCPDCGDQGVVGTTCTDCGCSQYQKEERRYGEPDDSRRDGRAASARGGRS
jgi:hypothetical protein